jgi:hypothetical protein
MKERRTGFSEVGVHDGQGPVRDGKQAVLLALSIPDPECLGPKIHIGDVQSNAFATANRRPIEGFQDSSVSLTEERFRRRCFEKPDHLSPSEPITRKSLHLGKRKPQSGIPEDDASSIQKGKEPANRGDIGSLGSQREWVSTASLPVPKKICEGKKMLLRHRPEVLDALFP